MKRNNLIKIVTLFLSCILLIGAVIGISVSAAGEPTVSIKAKNLSYEGAIKVLYAVDAQNVPEGAQVKMYFYDAAGSENPLYEKDAHNEDVVIGNASYKVFFSNGIAPKNMTAPVYAKAVIVDAEGAVLAESEIAEYSIYQYAINRFVNTPTEDQLFLYTAMLDYGASVQKMLVASGKMTEDDVIDNGGWADAYYGVRQDIVYNGNTVATGNATFHRKGDEVALSADHYYGTDGVFTDITDAEGNALTENAYPKTTVKATEAGVTAYTANYVVTGYAFRTFDDLCVDGSENDVNILHKGNMNYDAQNAFGTYVMNDTFGNASDAAGTAYQRVVENANGNNVYLVGANGKAAYNTLAFAFDHVIEGADKYIFQFDFNYAGRTDTAGGTPVWIRPETHGFGDQYDYAIIELTDSGSAYNTYKINNHTFTKGETYTIRYELVPRNRAYFDMDVYVDGVNVYSYVNAAPYANSATNGAYKAQNNIGDCVGFRLFNRASTDYSYTIDNVYLGAIGEYGTGNGLYANDELTYKYNNGTALADYTHGGDSSKYGKIENGVLNMGQSSLGIKNPGTTTGKKYVYETDFYVDTTKASATTTSENLGWWGFQSTNSRDKAAQYASYTLGYSAKDGKITDLYIKRNDGSTSTVKTLYPNTWYNIRIEYTPTTEYKGYVEFYVNGALMTSYTANGYANKGNISNAAFYGMGFEYRGSASNVSGIRYLYDNTYLAVDGGYGSGVYYNDATKLGTRYDCEALDTITFGKNGENASSTGYLKVENGSLGVKPNTLGAVTSSFGIANNPIGDATELPTGNVQVFETDIRFAGGCANGDDLNMGWLGMSSNGFVKTDFFVPLALYGVKGEDGSIVAYKISDHKKGGATVAALTTGEWYNLRFVYTANNTEADGVTIYAGTVEVFVNNVCVYEYETSGYSTGDTDNEPNNVFTQFGFQFRTPAQSTIGWFEMDMDNIFLGTFAE